MCGRKESETESSAGRPPRTQRGHWSQEPRWQRQEGWRAGLLARPAPRAMKLSAVLALAAVAPVRPCVLCGARVERWARPKQCRNVQCGRPPRRACAAPCRAASRPVGAQAPLTRCGRAEGRLRARHGLRASANQRHAARPAAVAPRAAARRAPSSACRHGPSPRLALRRRTISPSASRFWLTAARRRPPQAFAGRHLLDVAACQQSVAQIAAVRTHIRAAQRPPRARAAPARLGFRRAKPCGYVLAQSHLPGPRGLALPALLRRRRLLPHPTLPPVCFCGLAAVADASVSARPAAERADQPDAAAGGCLRCRRRAAAVQPHLGAVADARLAGRVDEHVHADAEARDVHPAEQPGPDHADPGQHEHAGLLSAARGAAAGRGELKGGSAARAQRTRSPALAPAAHAAPARAAALRGSLPWRGGGLDGVWRRRRRAAVVRPATRRPTEKRKQAWWLGKLHAARCACIWARALRGARAALATCVIATQLLRHAPGAASLLARCLSRCTYAAPCNRQ